METADRRTLLKMLTGLGVGAAMIGMRPVVDIMFGDSAEKANIQVVTEFCASWSSRDVDKALPFLADDCVYRMTETTPPAQGHAGIIERLKRSVDTSSLVEFRILDTAAFGPIVINHRIDRFMTPRPLTWEGVGVFFVKDGKIKALVTLLLKRSPLLPDVPTAAEMGIGKLTITPWAGFFGPAGLQPEVAEKLSAGLRAALARPDVQQQLVAQGFAAYGMTPAEFSAFFRKQYDGFVATVRENNVKFD